MSAREGGLLAAACLLAAGNARAAPVRLVLDPPSFAEAGAARAVAPPALDPGPSQAQIAWLAFGTDALFEAGVTATEVGFGAFGLAFLAPAPGLLVGSFALAGLVLILHPLADAMIVDAVASLGRRFRPSYLSALGGASLGCLLGTIGAVVAIATLAAWPVAEWTVATVVNALLPAAGAVIGERLGERPVPADDAPAAAAALAFVSQPRGADPAALAAAQSSPLLRWAL